MTGERRAVVLGDVIDDVLVVPSGPVRSNTDTAASIRRLPGGSASNTAAWLAASGVGVDFVGSVGSSDLERQFAVFTAAGVTPHLAGSRDLPTGTIVVLVEGETRSFLTERGANSVLDPETVTDAMLDAAAVLHLTGYSVVDSSSPAALRRLIERARERGLDVSVDPASAGYLSDFGPSRFLDQIAGATILLPNLDEGRVLTGLDEPEEIATALADRFDVVALTMGSAGVLLAVGAALTAVPSVDAAVLDPTGAGDAFSAGFLARWMEARDAATAARAGARLAARAVEVLGGRPSPSHPAG